MNILTRIKTILEGIPADAYDDEPLGSDFWQDERGNHYRPRGVDYRIIEDGSTAFGVRGRGLEIKLRDGQWVSAQWYNPGYDTYGKLKKGQWEGLPGRFAGPGVENDYRQIGNGLTGKNIPADRKVLLSSESAS